MSLSSERIDAYQRDGFLAPLPVVDSETAARFRREFDALEEREGRDTCRIGLLDRHFQETFIWEIASHPTILGYIESLIGEDILLLATHFFCKYRDETKFVAWHQDVTYWGLEPPEATTVWFAVDDSDVENGCMRGIPSSHRNGVMQHGKSNAAGNLLSINQEVGISADEERTAVDLELKSGQASIHHGQLVHGSLPNRTDRRRCGLTIRYVAPNVRQADGNSLGKRWSPVLVRGEDPYGNFELEPRPFS